MDRLPPEVDVERLLWVFCEALYALNNGEEIETAQRLFLRVTANRLAEFLAARDADLTLINR
jgi:hypothetical protein